MIRRKGSRKIRRIGFKMVIRYFRGKEFITLVFKNLK
jgi:hypothetical protein